MAATAELFPEISRRKVISASRRTDMVANPDAFVQTLKKAPADLVHTLVIWTKNPHNLLNHKQLQNQLFHYDQLFLHLTITGLGGTRIEPNVPPPFEVLDKLDELVHLCGSPRRIRLRFDPIIHGKEFNSKLVENLSFFEKLAPIAAHNGITDISISWVHIYPKVAKRLQRHGLSPLALSDKSRQQETEWLQNIAQKFKLRLFGCCVPGWPTSRCINGNLLNELHPLGYKCSTRKAKGQRKLCGCTESYDIGWYHSCVHGCMYCYGNPLNQNFKHTQSLEAGYECF